MSEVPDIQRKTVIVLLVLTVVVSVVGTWMVLNIDPDVNYYEVGDGDRDRVTSSTGNIHLRVLPQQQTQAAGSISFKVIPQE